MAASTRRNSNVSEEIDHTLQERSNPSLFLKILILGKSGQLGKAFNQLLQSTSDTVVAHSKSELDVTNSLEVEKEMARFQPEVTINCTAYTDVNAAETNPAPALELNHRAVKTLSDLCTKFESKLIHFSTDYVFDGEKKHPYTETDSENPLNEYGRSKLLGEQILKASKGSWLLLRSSWVHGEGPNNFINKLTQWSKGARDLRIVDDEISVPTSADDLAALAYQCIQAKLTGLFHLVNSGSASRYDFAMAIKKLLPNIKSNIQPAKLIEFTSGPRRPGYSVLDNSKVSNSLGMTPPHWQDALERSIRSRG